MLVHQNGKFEETYEELLNDIGDWCEELTLMEWLEETRRGDSGIC